MTRQKQYEQAIGRRLQSAQGLAALEGYLLAESGLPGPRANLELAGGLAQVIAQRGVDSEDWTVLKRWATLDESEAPTDDPHVLLPFCALQAMAALFPQLDPQRQTAVVSAFRQAANDGRWRLREAAAMAVQRIAEWDWPSACAILSDWLDTATLLEQRAIVAALAHPPILFDAERTSFCLQVSDRILCAVAASGGPARRSADFKVLLKGLMYALSVFVAAAPTEGFAFLSRWAAVEDPDIRRIIRANLSKARLARRGRSARFEPREQGGEERRGPAGPTVMRGRVT